MSDSKPISQLPYYRGGFQQAVADNAMLPVSIGEISNARISARELSVYTDQLINIALSGKAELEDLESLKLRVDVTESEIRNIYTEFDAERISVNQKIDAERSERISTDANLQQQINAHRGQGGALSAYEFGVPSDQVTMQMWLAHAMPNIWGGIEVASDYTLGASSYYTYLLPAFEDPITHYASDIFNATWVTNLQDGMMIQLANTPDTSPAIFDIAVIGNATVSQATNDLLGIVKGKLGGHAVNADGEFYHNYNVLSEPGATVALAATSNTDKTTSTGAVASTTINAVLQTIWNKIRSVVNALADYVPITRTVNGKALSANVSLNASDVGAAESAHNHALSGDVTGTLNASVVQYLDSPNVDPTNPNTFISLVPPGKVKYFRVLGTSMPLSDGVTGCFGILRVARYNISNLSDIYFECQFQLMFSGDGNIPAAARTNTYQRSAKPNGASNTVWVQDTWQKQAVASGASNQLIRGDGSLTNPGSDAAVLLSSGNGQKGWSSTSANDKLIAGDSNGFIPATGVSLTNDNHPAPDAVVLSGTAYGRTNVAMKFPAIPTSLGGTGRINGSVANADYAATAGSATSASYLSANSTATNYTNSIGGTAINSSFRIRLSSTQYLTQIKLTLSFTSNLSTSGTSINVGTFTGGLGTFLVTGALGLSASVTSTAHACGARATISTNTNNHTVTLIVQPSGNATNSSINAVIEGTFITT